MSSLFNVYTSLLESTGLKVEENGHVSDAKGRPYIVNGKPLVLPYPAILSSPAVSGQLVFHPFGEAAPRGESDVLIDMRARITKRLNHTTGKLMMWLVQLGKGEIKNKIDADQLKALAAAKDIGTKEAEDIRDIIVATSQASKKTPIIRITLSRHRGVHDGRKYSRLARVSFPLYEAIKAELAEKTKGFSILGVQTNKKTLNAVMRLLEYILPDLDKPDHYNAYTQNSIAPFTHALLCAAGEMAAVLNERLAIFKDEADIAPQMLSETWAEASTLIDDLYSEITMIPVQPDADGIERASDVHTGMVGTAAPVAVPTATAAPNLAVGNAMRAAIPAAAPAPAAPVGAPEQEWIVVNGKMARNPNYRLPITGYGVPNAPVAHDPYQSGMLLPASAAVVPATTMYPSNSYGAPTGYPTAQPQGGYPSMQSGYPGAQPQRDLSRMDFGASAQPAHTGYHMPRP